MKSGVIFAFLIITILLFSCRTAPEVITDQNLAVEQEEIDEDTALFLENLPKVGSELPVSVYNEVWVYVVAGRETALKPNIPVTDIGYFAADVNLYGSLVDVPNRRKLPAFSGRVHLVAKCDGRSLTHFVLTSGSAERKALVADLIAATKDYDGLQIDFENVPQKDADTFLSFLADLKAGLGSKIFTVALPARIRKNSDDVYSYEKIKPLVDRILVMAYDEHWSTSSPGPIASLPWCRRVANYCLETIGKEKLIMGIPFYGRAWGSPGHSQAYVYTGIERVIKENNVSEIRHENGIPTFDYKATISVKVYYEDEYSLSTRMEMYRSMGVASIGFWRLGQETPAIWELLSLGN